MIQIIACHDRFDELVDFITRLNSNGEHHIGFFGEGEADVRASLAECLVPPAENFMLAYEGDKLIGILGVDIDPEINRAWFFGPLVEHVDWHSIADQLYMFILPRIPATICDRDLFCDVQNVHLDEFAARHGFLLRSENAVLELERNQYTPSAKRTSHVILYQSHYLECFETLHKQLFPNAYFTARQITEKLDENHQLFLAVENDQLLGYHFGKIELGSKLGYVDFIGTDASARGRGIGADLLASGIDWMLSAASTKKINLTVNADNVPALHLYETFGFVTARVMRAYRKQMTQS